MPRNRLLKPAGVCVAACLCVALFLSLGFTLSKGAWSQPHFLAEGSRHYGFKSVLMDSKLLISTISLSADTILIKAIESGVVREDEMTQKVDDLVDYSLVANHEQFAIVWLERNATSSRLYVKTATNTEPTLIKETNRYIEGLSAALDDSGRLAVAWTDDSAGLQAVFLQLLTLDGEILLDTVQVSQANVFCSEPSVALSGETLHVLYKEHEQVFTNVVHRAVAINSFSLTQQLRLRRTSSATVEMPICHAAENGGVSVYWAQDAQSRGAARGSVIMYAYVGLDGVVLEAPHEQLHCEGSTSGVTVAKGSYSNGLLAYINNSSGTFQVYVASGEGEVSLATYGTKHRFGPQVHEANGKLLVAYYEIGASSVEVFMVEYIPNANTPLVVRLGLDPNAPLLDGVFKMTTVFISATVLAFLAVGAVVLTALISFTAVRKLHANTHASDMGGHILVYAVLALLKRYGGYLYYGAIFVPGASGVLISLGSMVFAFACISLARVEKRDMFALCVSGFAWAFADAFCSVYVRGVGLW